MNRLAQEKGKVEPSRKEPALLVGMGVSRGEAFRWRQPIADHPTEAGLRSWSPVSSCWASTGGQARQRGKPRVHRHAETGREACRLLFPSLVRTMGAAEQGRGAGCHTAGFSLLPRQQPRHERISRSHRL
uniref:Uncharacterized protein n=1 Tax=Sphaerodactylus townsendi TaxID=933632 RepID=A0ACB8EJ35_9SAUR